MFNDDFNQTLFIMFYKNQTDIIIVYMQQIS